MTGKKIMGSEEFDYQYDITKNQEVMPRNRNFKMLVPPGFYVNQYGGDLYESFTSDLVLNFSRNSMLFIDIGAHYGYYTLLVGTRHPTCKIIAFEPVPENFEILKRNVVLNGLRNVDLQNLAVSDKEGLRKLKVREISGQSGFYEQHVAKTCKEINVVTVCFDNFYKETLKVPTIVKIDTEGNEPYVLQGMKKFLRDSEEIKLVIEFNPDCLRSAGYDPAEFLGEVFRFGFDIYVIDDDQRMTYKLAQDNLGKWHNYLPEGEFKKTYTNMLCVKKQKSLGVLFFSHSSQLAGAERSLLELVTELIRDHGVICSVVLPNDGPLRKKLEQVGASTLTANYDWWCDSSLPADEEISRRLNNSFGTTLEQIKEKVEKINPDVIVTNTIVIPWGAIVASLLNKPHVWFVHEFGRLDHGLEFYVPFQKVLEIIRDSSNIILTNSNAVRKELFGNISGQNILTVSHHIDIPPDILYEDRNDYFTKADATKLIITGTISKSKGQEDAILAVRELIKRKKDVELIIVGYSAASYLEELKYLVEDENLEEYVRFIDFKENVYPIINQADIVLVCSRNEAFGRITLEAMLLGKPVVGTNSAGTLELIRDGFNGLLYEPGDYIQLADKIQYLIEHKDKLKEFGENGYEFAKKNFTKEEFSGKLYELLTNLKGAKNPCSNNLFRFSANLMSDTLSETLFQQKDLQAQISRLEALVSEKDGEKRNLKGKINHIYNSYGWRLYLVCYRTIDRILPVNTKRRLFARIILNALMKPKGFLVNVNKNSLRNFIHYFRTSKPALLEEMFERYIWGVSQVSKSHRPRQVSKSHRPRIETPGSLEIAKTEDLNFTSYSDPLVSIIIPVRNNWRYTYACLKSILQNTKEIPFEIILIDDQSTDETSEMLKRISGIQIINNPINLGWVKNCNNAAHHAKGKYMLLLNNDTEVTEGWLSNLVEIAEGDDKVGVVGGKILYPDGRLQEAGSVMDAEGRGQSYGRFDDPARYEYNYVKETDFITGVCLLIGKDIFLKMGGFDERYAPAFYEEFDLEFAIREAGYKIMYQPRAVIVHHQTSSYGPEIRDSLSSCNHAKFMEKWVNQICKQIEQSDIFLARDRSKNKKIILFINDKVPDYDKYAGSLTIYQYIRLFKEMGFKVIFIPDSLIPLEPYTTELQQMGIEVVYGQLKFRSWIKQNGQYIHYVWLSRPNFAIKYIKEIKKHTQAKILYYTHDLHYLRELRRYEIEKKEEILSESNRLKDIEFYLFENVDTVLTPSDHEKKIIEEKFQGKQIVTIPAYYYETNSIDEESLTNFYQRDGLIFLGGFGHLPNVDGVKWFIREIYPLIKQKLPEIKLYIVGSNPLSDIVALSSTDIVVTGFVKDLDPLFQKRRVFVSPLRYGAGVKGKIITSMAYGVPVVTTNIGNEGINLKNGAEAFITDDPTEFANRTIELYTNPELWMNFSRNSVLFVKNNFLKLKAKNIMLDICGIIREKCKL